jgi:hypothetical protein
LRPGECCNAKEKDVRSPIWALFDSALCDLTPLYSVQN